MKTLPFRQIHLDFHTSEDISGIGSRYSSESFRQALRDAHVDSITLTAKCHHGWMYYPSARNAPHPHLDCDLLGNMISDARKEGVHVIVYVSAGYDERQALEHPEWLMRNADESLNTTPDFLHPGYHQFCQNSPYQDVLMAQIEDVLSTFKVDGLFLDIVGERECYCNNCIRTARERGIDPRDKAAMQPLWRENYRNYINRVQETVDHIQPGIEIFHNSGHVDRGRKDLQNVNSHLELESLPTGGWGYDHFVVSARYVQGLGTPFLGMTGRFHYGWGDFGGYKHPAGLIYETSRFLAHGGGCSIGDQMHPYGYLEPGLYRMIGKAYTLVESKEPWCRNVTSVADIGILSLEATGAYSVTGAVESNKKGASDTGAVQLLTGTHHLFDVVGRDADFTKYKVLVLPDGIIGDDCLKKSIDAFIAGGGHILASGISGTGAVCADGRIAMKLPLGVQWLGQDPDFPNYIQPEFPLGDLDATSFVMYFGSQEIEQEGKHTVLGWKEKPFFKRDLTHFSSHYHTVGNREKASPGIVENTVGIYIAWNIFEEYARKGSLSAKYIVSYLLDRLLEKGKTLEGSFSTHTEVTLMHQESENRDILHLIHGSPVARGVGLHIVEENLPSPDFPVKIRVGKTVKRVYLAPMGSDIPYRQDNDGVSLTVPSFICHQMVVLEY